MSIANACKSRWYNIRDQYRKVLNKKKTTSGQAATKQLKYKYDNQLSFLKKTFQERPTITNIDSNDSEEYDDTAYLDNPGCSTDMNISIESPINSNTSTPMPTQQSTLSKFAKGLGKKNDKETASAVMMKYLIDKKSKEENDTLKHHVDVFLAGIAFTMKELDPYRVNIAKTRIFSIIQELEMDQIMNDQRQVYTQTSQIPVTQNNTNTNRNIEHILSQSIDEPYYQNIG